MISEQNIDFFLDQYVGCFGGFRKNDPLCRSRCAINLRCAIEFERNERFEILEELVSVDGMVIKVN
jgi:hypothetical protein